MADESPIATQDQLGELLEGQTDDDINAFVAEAGVNEILGQIFSAMEERFQADKAAGQSAVVQWDITAPDQTYSYTVTIADGTCKASEGAAEAPRLTLGLALPDFLRFVAGKLDGMQAFMSGKLRLGGDMMFAQQMQAWFAA
ncbi:MAG: SCP2 sterol-binding domain-containing protein [Actinobacteria bacterium]|nr:SCP2 sterol-binding domain-containing protein [Actinomycetota bacterium]